MTTQTSGQSDPVDQPCSTSPPDRGRLPDAVADLDWQPHTPGTAYHEDATLLVAVPVLGEFSYQLAVISALNGGDYLDWYCNGEVWEWAIDDADFVVRL